MELSVGTVVEGKVKQITKFGAFILLPDHSTGMVHISEIAHSFVNDIHDHLTEGQTVMVLVIGNENGKVNLSIKRLEPKPQRENGGNRNGNYRGAPRQDGGERWSRRPSRSSAAPARRATAHRLTGRRVTVRSLPVRRASVPPTTAAARRSPPPRLPRRRQSPSTTCSSSS